MKWLSRTMQTAGALRKRLATGPIDTSHGFRSVVSHPCSWEDTVLDRRQWLAAAFGTLFVSRAAASPVRQTVAVRKQPGCGCCDKWVTHLEAAGFEATVVEDPALDAFRDRLGVPRALRSCHTGVVGDYVVEGHVPADLVRKMVDEKPDITGIAVAGMPIGSPGMEGPRPQSYNVTAFRRDGSTYIYARR